MYAFLITFLLIVFLAIAFSLQNAEPVILNFFSLRYQGSLVVALLTALACGVLLSVIACVPSFIKKSRLIAQQQKTIAQLKQAASEVEDEHTQTNVHLEQPETEQKQLTVPQDVS